MAAYPGEPVEWRRLPDAGKLALFTTTEPQKFIGIAVCDGLLGQVDRQVRALEASKIYNDLYKSVRKNARYLIDKVGGNPAEILVSAADQNGRVKVLTIPSTTALEEQALANEAAAAVHTPTRPATNLLRLPSVKPEQDRTSPEWRRAEFLRLSALPRESWSENEELWMLGYSRFGDCLPWRSTEVLSKRLAEASLRSRRSA